MKLIILAGGKSARMGRDKAEIRLGNRRLIDVVYARAKIQCNEIWLSGPDDYGLGLDYIPDLPDGPKGPVAALYAAIQSLKGEPGFFTVPVDGPNFPADLCERLYAGRTSIAKSPSGLHQAYGWWRMDDLNAAFSKLDLRGSISLRKMAERCHARHVTWLDETLFYNINTPNDLAGYLTAIPPQDRA